MTLRQGFGGWRTPIFFRQIDQLLRVLAFRGSHPDIVRAQTPRGSAKCSRDCKKDLRSGKALAELSKNPVVDMGRKSINHHWNRQPTIKQQHSKEIRRQQSPQ